ncbi:2-aminobenzoate-CoA ligase [Marinicauda salina]|uniref:2-aminobenzoate-CoA ligase n=1 Tax=Marinicauda salina TaxID=2135793 RepID=A0A2U2BV73_9PROT|nr:2-aminobenzoate-CoA ligase [Marinicauda salina]
MEPTGYADSFARDNLPDEDDWPDLIFNRPGLQYPPRLNAAVELLDKTVAAGHGDRVAVYSSEKTLTYAELNAAANRLAHVLVDDLGLVSGNRVLLHGGNSADLMIAWHAVLKAGGIAVATMPMLRETELTKIVRKAEVRLALVDPRFAEPAQESQAAGSGLERVAEFGPHSTLEEMAAGKPATFEACDAAADDVALLAFTSGTTGEPKACAHFHRSILAMADTFARHCLDPQPGDVYAGTPPFAFTFGLGAFVVFPARFGAAVALPDRPGFEALCETIERFGVTHTFTAPTGYRAMIGLAERFDLCSLKGGVSAGEHLPEATWRAWNETTGVELIDGIGATEMIHIFISAPAGEIRPGATGKPVPGYEARLIDDAGAPLAVGETGRLAVRGPTGCLYLADERQKSYVQDGWNVTGDVFRTDEDGYFWYVSRSDDMIVSSGYNIAAIEVEQALLKHDAVAECAVAGRPCAERGAIVSAHVVLKDPARAGDALARELQDFVKATIAPYKYPRAVAFVDDLPKTQTGKLQRFRLENRDESA